jgi:hypothetical protein
VRSDGHFSITGEASLHIDMGPLELNAGMSITLSDSRFAASVYGSLDIHIDLGLFEINETLAGFSGSIELTPVSAYLSASVTIVGISVSGSYLWSWGSPPVISHQVGDTLYLHMGDASGRYGSGDLYDDTVHEAYSLKQQDGIIYVYALGQTQTYAASSVRRIVANGGAGNDSITVQPGVEAILEFEGGEGNDNFVIASGGAGSVISGGAGKDTLTGGRSSGISYYGGLGDDKFVGGLGDEYVDMGAGNNTIFGGAGNDTIRVDVGVTTVDAGLGDDTITVGTTGVLTLSAGPGVDRLVLDTLASGGASILLGDENGKNEFVHGARTIFFDDDLERFELHDTSAVTRIVTENGYSWGATDLAIDADGVADVTAATFVIPEGMLALRAAGINGVLRTQLGELSVTNTGAAGVAAINVTEADGLTIVDDGRANAGLFTANGAIDVRLAGREALLTLASGVISTASSGGGIQLVADDVDFASGADKVRGTGTLTLHATAVGQNYRVGAAGQSTFGNDYSLNGDTGYFELGMRDLSALRDGFSEIRIGHQNAGTVTMAIGDVEDKSIGDLTFSARLTDPARFIADDYRIMGDVQSTQALRFSGRTMDVRRQNLQDPMGAPDSGLYAPELYIDLTEQMLVSGWVKADNLVSITVSASTGARGLVGYGADINSFTADPGSFIFTLNDNGRIDITTSKSIVSGTTISAAGAGSQINMTAGTGLTLLEGGGVVVLTENSAINLASQTYLHINSGSAVMAGVTGDDENGKFVVTKVAEGTSITLRTAGELSLDGGVAANGTLDIQAGATLTQRVDYFNRINGNELVRTTDSALVPALLDALQRRDASNADLLALIRQGHVNLGSTVTITSLSNYTPFESLSAADKILVAQRLGYTAYDGGFYNATAAGAHFVTTLTSGVVNDGYTRYDVPVFFNADAAAGRRLLTGFIQGQSADYSNSLVDWLAAGVAAPAVSAGFDSLTDAQKLVVAKYLGYEYDAEYQRYFNYNAPQGRKVATTFSQGVVTDYRNEDIYWGAAGAPAAGTAFTGLTQAQQQVVARALGYEMYTGTTWYKESAARGVQVVKTFATGPVQYAIDAIDWGGPGKPADGASFEDLTTAQRALVAETLGYAVFDRQMFYKADAAAADRLILVPVQGQHYQNSAIDWTGLPTAGQGVTFDQLTVQQQQRVLDTIGYRRFDGVIYQDADASADKRYVLTFTEGTDYTNAGITWSTVSIPAAGTAFADLSAQQQFRVLEQTGWSQYTGRVYFRAAATKELVTNFIEGFDYRNADMPWGDAGTTPATRWVVTDGTTKVVVVALDDDGNGVTDGVMVTEPHELFDQGAYGFLLTGTIANLADNHGITIASTEDVIIRGNIQLLGAGSDLVLQSNRWVYWEGEAEIHGNIDIRGGVTLRPGAGQRRQQPRLERLRARRLVAEQPGSRQFHHHHAAPRT